MIKILNGTKTPISDIGKYAGTCWGTNTSDESANYKRGMGCISDMHGRTFEYPDLIMEIDGYSARVIREFYTHVAGTTRLQESTRYVNCSDFKYYIPDSLINHKDSRALLVYNLLMETISDAYKILDKDFKIPKEDIANILPLGMSTKIVVKMNMRAILHMFEERTCNRAYIEFRELMKEMRKVISNYSEQWKEVMNKFAVTKCDKLGYCPEHKGCGRYGHKEK